MKNSWEDVPKSVDLKDWFKADILAPHQKKKKRQLLVDVGRQFKPSEKSFEQYCFESDRLINKSLAELAEKEGNKWLENFVSDVLEEELQIPELSFYDEIIHESCADIRDLWNIPELHVTGEIEDILEDELGAFTEAEYSIPMSLPVDERSAVEASVSEALEDF